FHVPGIRRTPTGFGLSTLGFSDRVRGNFYYVASYGSSDPSPLRRRSGFWTGGSGGGRSGARGSGGGSAAPRRAQGRGVRGWNRRPRRPPVKPPERPPRVGLDIFPSYLCTKFRTVRHPEKTAPEQFPRWHKFLRVTASYSKSRSSRALPIRARTA